MYEQVKRKEKKATNKKLWFALSVWTVVVIILAALVIFGFRYRSSFPAASIALK